MRFSRWIKHLFSSGSQFRNSNGSEIGLLSRLQQIYDAVIADRQSALHQPENKTRLREILMAAFRSIELHDVSLRVVMEGAGPLVVLVHGFPKSWSSWRHQIRPVASAGFTVCTIDVRGYGGSSNPYLAHAYRPEKITSDIAQLIDILSTRAPAVIVGHDCGAPIC